jgi:DNA-binding transcriptional ArsR family regulator
MAIRNIPLKFDAKVDFINGITFKVSRKSQNLVIFLNGDYENKIAVSSVSKTNWKKTQNSLKEALESKGVSSDHINLVLDNLDNNSDVILSNIDGNSNNTTTTTDDSISYENREMSKDWVIAEIDKTKAENKSISFKDWRDGLLKRYATVKEITGRNFPHAWEGIEFTLIVLKILNIGACTLPFAGIMLARSGGNKTLSSSMLIPWPFVYYTRKFTAKAFVSHTTAISSQDLPKIDMLPKIRFKMLLTPELAPIFSANEDELLENIGIITSVLDGKGYVSDSGAHGQRGYHGNYHFVWVGATVDIPYRVHKMFSSLGPKLYTLRLSYVDPSDAEVEDGMDEKFEKKRREVQEAIIDYLIWFEACPILTQDPETCLPKMDWDSKKDDITTKKYLTKLARFLGKLRCHVDIWSQKQPGEHKYSDYGYAIPNPEDPRRAATSLYNLTRGHALTQGRNYITVNDLHLAIKVALSTASQERIAVLDLLVAKKGVVTISTIANALSMSKSTALKTMTELEAVGIADIETAEVGGNKTKRIVMRKNFTWLYEEEFLRLKGDYSPVDRSRYNVKYQEDTKVEAFWIKFQELELASENGYVKEIQLKDKLLTETNGIFVGPIDIEIFLKKMVQKGELLLGIVGYSRKDVDIPSAENANETE